MHFWLPIFIVYEWNPQLTKAKLGHQEALTQLAPVSPILRFTQSTRPQS